MSIRIGKDGVGHFQPPAPEPVKERRSELASALRQLAIIGLSAGAAISLTYVIPPLAEYRPWVKGDPPPFAVYFGGKPSNEGLPKFVASGPKHVDAASAAEKAGVSAELMAEAQAAAAEDGGDDELVNAPPIGDAPAGAPSAVPNDAPAVEPPLPNDAPAAPDGQPGVAVPVPEPEIKVAAPKAVDTVDLSAEALAEDTKGITGELEFSENLGNFYQKLLATARREPGAITRISHYGASEIGADGLTSAARRKFQARFGSAGKGWVNVAPGWEWYKHKDVVWRTRGWSSRTVTSDDLSGAKVAKGRYGFGGVAGVGGPGDEASYKVFADRLELFYFGYAKGGTLSVTVNDGEEQLLLTAADPPADLTKVFRGTPGIENKFVVKNKSGNTHVYGVSLETDGPGVVYDCIQLIGTRASRFLNFDEEHLKTQTALRKPDLQIILYGGNELVDRDMALAPYEKKYMEVIRRMRAGAPEGSCIVMSPQDHGERVRGKVRTVPLLLELIPIQQRVAKAMGCAFFNTLAAMGGEDTMGRWYDSTPRLVSGDYAHLTPAGDRVLGSMVYKAIMKGFADHLAKGQP